MSLTSEAQRMHHYIESGLPYVWLVDGYRLESTPYGEALSIQDADGLHRAIARWIAESLPRIAGREVKFLRLELDCTQAELGERLGVTEQTVSLWERRPDKPVPAAADRLLRLLVEAWLDEGQPLSGALARVQGAAHQQPVTRQPFRRVRTHWLEAA